MSDFDSDAWGLAVAIVTLVSVAACAGLLWIVGRKYTAKHGSTTGHVWDGDLQELNNPLPRWWMGLFYATIAFAFGYMIFYPGLGYWAGTQGWSSTAQHDQEARALEARVRPLYDELASKSVSQLAAEPRAVAIGERLFLNSCAQCHGSDARGSKGFPNLADSDWLYGGSPEAIRATITGGRHGVMPPMAEAIGSAADLENLVQYVLSLSGSASDPAKASLGKPKFVMCAACHGASGQGNAALGAPNLTDKIWLHGGGSANVLDTIRKGRINSMPAHGEKLSPEQIEVLTAYVWGLSNKVAPTTTASAEPRP